ncbi:MAG: hypothetical protein JSU94_00735 [Phycisphaerales bacterium]|nr:MAG: hypothetical protein JSU94_00735 [Phycisphaerales bacterium]
MGAVIAGAAFVLAALPTRALSDPNLPEGGKPGVLLRRAFAEALSVRESLQRDSSRRSDVRASHGRRLLDAYEVSVDSSVALDEKMLGEQFCEAGWCGNMEVRLRGKRQAGAYHWFRISFCGEGRVSELAGVKVTPAGSGLAYVRWRVCAKGSAAQIIERLRKFDNLRGVIVDLRGNPGGHLLEAVLFAEQWVPANSEIMSLYRSVQDMQAERNGFVWKTRLAERWGVPVVFITDRETASTAEALVAIFKSRKLAVSVGQPTRGDGLAYVVVEDKATGNTSQRPTLIVVPGLALYHNSGIPADRTIPAGCVAAEGEQNGTFERRCMLSASVLLKEDTNRSGTKKEKANSNGK